MWLSCFPLYPKVRYQCVIYNDVGITTPFHTVHIYRLIKAVTVLNASVQETLKRLPPFKDVLEFRSEFDSDLAKEDNHWVPNKIAKSKIGLGPSHDRV
jgi:hypothetical protein